MWDTLRDEPGMASVAGKSAKELCGNVKNALPHRGQPPQNQEWLCHTEPNLRA